MAIIKCEECEKEISDTVKKCPHCGFSIKKTKSDNKISFIKKHLKIILILITILVISILGVIIYNIKTNTLTEDEKMVATIVKKYQSALKNPDSMQIFEIRKYDKFVLMDTSGQNGFGGNTRNIVSYSFDSTYLGNDSKADRTVTKYTSAEDKIEIVFAQAIKTNWKTRTDYVVIDKDKILRNLDQSN